MHAQTTIRYLSVCVQQRAQAPTDTLMPQGPSVFQDVALASRHGGGFQLHECAIAMRRVTP